MTQPPYRTQTNPFEEKLKIAKKNLENKRATDLKTKQKMMRS